MEENIQKQQDSTLPIDPKEEEILLSEELRIGEFTPKKKSYTEALDEFTNPQEILVDKDLPIFVHEWIANGGNATQAYIKLHPNVSYESARVLGSRMLGRIDGSVIFANYGVDSKICIDTLKESLNATKIDKSGNSTPDYKTRLAACDRLVKILGLNTGVTV